MTRTLLRLAKRDASVDFELRRFDGARVAFTHNLGLAEADWPDYREAYEIEFERRVLELRARLVELRHSNRCKRAS